MRFQGDAYIRKLWLCCLVFFEIEDCLAKLVLVQRCVHAKYEWRNQ